MRLQTEEDIQRLIEQGIPESYHFEYKRKPWLKNKKGNIEIAKDISALANTEGGVLIIGIDEDKKTKKLKSHPFSFEDLAERITQVLESSVKEPISGYRIKLIPPDSPEGYMVIEIPESPNKPHMVTVKDEHRYYKRVNSVSIPMTNREVEQLCMMRLEQEKKSEEFYSDIYNILKREKQRTKARDKWSQIFCLFLPKIFKKERFSLYDKDFTLLLQNLLSKFDFPSSFSREGRFLHFFYGSPENYSTFENIWMHYNGGVLIVGARIDRDEYPGSMIPLDYPLFIEKAFRFVEALFSKNSHGIIKLKVIITLVNVGKWHIVNFLPYYPNELNRINIRTPRPPDLRDGEPDIIIQRDVPLWQLQEDTIIRLLKEDVYVELLKKFGH